MNELSIPQIPSVLAMDATRREAFARSLWPAGKPDEPLHDGGQSSVRMETAERHARGALYCVDLHIRLSPGGEPAHKASDRSLKRA